MEHIVIENVGQVKKWTTFNEPNEVCIDGYGDGTNAPLVDLNGVGEYYCIDTIIKAHAAAYHLYKNQYYQKYGGKIGITLNSRYFFSDQNDKDIVERGMQFWVRTDTIYDKQTLHTYIFHFGSA